MNESKATRYQRARRRAQAAAVAAAALVLCTLAFTGVGPALAAWSRPGAVLVSIVAWRLAVWAAVWLSAWPDRRVNRSLSWRDAYDASRGPAVVALIAVPVLAGVVLSSGAAAGWAWWIVAAGAAGALLVAALHLAPGILARASGAQPVERPELVERLGVLARQVKVPIQSIDSLPPASTVTSSALVAGAGDNRRVFIADELMRDWKDEEIAVVVAHELAHHAHRDLWTTLALDVLVLAAGFKAADLVIVARQPVPTTVPVGFEALPLIALVASAVWLLAAPIRHAVSRWQERRADSFALELTGSADAFQAAIRRLAASHLAEERPSRLTRWFYHRHPPVAERLRAAEATKR